MTAMITLRSSINSARETHLRIMSSASQLSLTSSGKYSWFFQSMILRYVSCAFSLQNGGYPTRHSNMMAPSDHQSHSCPYPCWRKISGAI